VKIECKKNEYQMNKFWLILLFLPFYSHQLFAQSNFRDSIDILEYTINLDLSKTETQQIWGKCDIVLKPVYELSKIKLDLEGLITDSVLAGQNRLKFSFDGDFLQIFPDKKLKSSDTIKVSVYYHGKPKQDKQWGGFFIDKDYAFNMGVGMEDTPPNYGRVWYPCIDNFTDRALYRYLIKTKSSQKAACPGILESETSQSDGTIIYNWKLNQSIPTYLSSVAVANYSLIKDTVKGIERIIPIEVYTERGSESKTKKSFQNLKLFFHAFENRFGSYQWDKIGYVSTKFTSGAMEHATMISYSNYCNGSSSCESTFAHELSHHWFGDLVTCSSEKDMWLNEGWASYCEAIYYEYVGGETAYKKYVRENHKNVLTYALNNSFSSGSLYGMPHADTYGSVVYDKGADVAHTLRGQIGDSLFFQTLKQYFKDYAFKSISVEEFKNYLSTKTNIDLSDFFNFWIYSGGFPHFSIKNLEIQPIKNKYELSFVLEQRLLNTDKFLNSSVVEVGVLDKNLKLITYKLKQAGKSYQQKLILDYEPKLVIVDPNEKVSDAITDEYLIIEKPGNYQFQDERLYLAVNSLSNPVFYHFSFNWIAPTNEKPNSKIKKLYDKFWEIKYYSSGLPDFILKYNFSLSALKFDKETSTKEKLQLLFRTNSGEEWIPVKADIEIQGNQGLFELKDCKTGQYTVGLVENQ
jgi:aminopeptidase N